MQEHYLQSHDYSERLPMPMLGICAAASGMGKTTLLESLLPLLAAHGVQVSVIKQARADFDIDRPGKDTYRMREAGAAQVLVSSPGRWVLMTEINAPDQDNDGANLEQLASHFDPMLADLVLVEGYRNARIPKIEVYRPSLGKPLLAALDANIIAVASDVSLTAPVTQLNLNRPGEVAEYILGWLAMRQRHEVAQRYAPCCASA